MFEFTKLGSILRDLFDVDEAPNKTMIEYVHIDHIANICLDNISANPTVKANTYGIRMMLCIQCLAFCVYS